MTKSTWTLLLFLATPSFAGVEGVTEYSTGSYPITDLKSVVVSTQVPRCPEGAMCDPFSVATVTVGLNGCLDNLGPVTYLQENTSEGKRRLMVSALGITDSRSERTRCFVQNTASFKINLGLGFWTNEGVVVDFLRSVAQK